ncbi:MAG: hypothetical protein Q9183_006250, partial [Haloplaca sp. 2 TL-2023]
SCAVGIGISPVAINNITSATISSIAQEVVATCSALPGSIGGWGRYAETYMVIFSTADNSSTSVPESNSTLPQQTSNSTDAAARELSADDGVTDTQLYSYYIRSFWRLYGAHFADVEDLDVTPTQKRGLDGVKRHSPTTVTRQHRNSNNRRRSSQDSVSAGPACVPIPEKVKSLVRSDGGSLPLVNTNIEKQYDENGNEIELGETIVHSAEGWETER